MTAPEGFGPLRAAYDVTAAAVHANLDESIAAQLDRDDEIAYDALADFCGENRICYGCGEPDDTDLRDPYCSTCDPTAAADRAAEDARDAAEAARVEAAEAADLERRSDAHEAALDAAEAGR